jgi:hypothetical protein
MRIAAQSQSTNAFTMILTASLATASMMAR